MTPLVLSLAAVSFVISLVATFVVRRVAIRVNFVDKPGHRKIHSKPIALGGGIAIFIAFAVPMLIGLAVVRWSAPLSFITIPQAYWDGAREQSPLAISFLAACAALHVMGL